MTQFKCPMGEVSKEGVARVVMIKDLTIRLHAAYKELETIMEELKKLEIPVKKNKNECKNACPDCGAHVDAECR